MIKVYFELDDNNNVVRGYNVLTEENVRISQSPLSYFVDYHGAKQDSHSGLWYIEVKG
jgi:hypothetical protein